MGTQSTCISEARGVCANGYTGCDSQNSSGCYSYTCKSASTATPTPTAAPTAAPSGCSSINTQGECEGEGCYWNLQTNTCSSNSSSSTTTSTPTPTPTSTASTITCYKFENNTCSSETITGTSCPNDYYSNWADCRENISCSSGQYKYGNTCINCGNYGTIAYDGCQGNAQTCCISDSTETTTCYSISGNKCAEVQVGGSSCGSTGTNAYSSQSECETHLSSVGSSSAGDSDECTIKEVSVEQKLVSPDLDSNSYNSYYIVQVSLEGDGCSDQEVTAEEILGSESEIRGYTTSSGKRRVTFVVYPSDSCAASQVLVSLSNGESATASAIDTSSDWNENVGSYNPSGTYYTSSYNADVNNSSVYYSDYNNETGSWERKWTRGCGSSGSSGGSTTTTTPTPEPPTYHCYANAKDIENATSAIWSTSGSDMYPYVITALSQSECLPRACYVSSDGSDYVWSTTAPSGYQKVAIYAKDNCKPEAPACYYKDNQYVWGKHKNDSGYILITSINNENDCINDSDDYACYVKDDSYIWTISQPTGYTKVDTATTAEECIPDEKEACYIHDGKYYWGTYERYSGYSLIGGITDKEYCSGSGCYVDKKGEYVWGDYSGDDEYELVPDITIRKQCGYTPDVPKTAMNTQTIIYIAVAIMSVAGIYFVVDYNNKTKKI